MEKDRESQVSKQPVHPEKDYSLRRVALWPEKKSAGSLPDKHRMIEVKSEICVYTVICCSDIF